MSTLEEAVERRTRALSDANIIVQNSPAHSKAKGVEVTTRASETGPVDHIAFAAQDYDSVLARLQRLGVSVRVNDNPGNTVRQLFVFDPNGVKIEINFRK